MREYPLRESLRGLLMLRALPRRPAGRRARRYQDARTALVDELGLDPGRAAAAAREGDPAPGPVARCRSAAPAIGARRAGAGRRRPRSSVRCAARRTAPAPLLPLVRSAAPPGAGTETRKTVTVLFCDVVAYTELGRPARPRGAAARDVALLRARGRRDRAPRRHGGEVRRRRGDGRVRRAGRARGRRARAPCARRSSCASRCRRSRATAPARARAADRRQHRRGRRRRRGRRTRVRHRRGGRGRQAAAADARRTGEVLLGERDARARRARRRGDAARAAGREGSARPDGVPARVASTRMRRRCRAATTRRWSAASASSNGSAALAPRSRAAAAPAGDDRRRARDRQVAARARVPGRARGRGDSARRPLPALRRGDHLLAAARAARGRPAATRSSRARATRSSPPRAASSRSSPRERPLIAVFDDVHWAEPTFLDFVEYLAGPARRRAACSCSASHGPQLAEQRPAWLHPPAAALVLEPLSEADSQRLLEALGVAGRRRARGSPRPPRETRSSSSSSPRSPTRTAPRARCRPRSAASSTSGSTGSPATERAVLERAAVAGRSFSLDAVLDLTPAEEREDVQARLLALARKQLRPPRPDRPGGGLPLPPRADPRRGLRRHPEEHPRRPPRARRRAARGTGRRGRRSSATTSSRRSVFRRELGSPDAGARRARRPAASAPPGEEAFGRSDLPATISLFERARALLPPDEADAASFRGSARRCSRPAGSPRPTRCSREPVEAAASDAVLERHAQRRAAVRPAPGGVGRSDRRRAPGRERGAPCLRAAAATTSAVAARSASMPGSSGPKAASARRTKPGGEPPCTPGPPGSSASCSRSSAGAPPPRSGARPRSTRRSRPAPRSSKQVADQSRRTLPQRSTRSRRSTRCAASSRRLASLIREGNAILDELDRLQSAGLGTTRRSSSCSPDNPGSGGRAA